MIEWLKYLGEFSGWLNALIAFILLLIAWKSGFLKFILELKNGNGNGNKLLEYKVDENQKNLEKLAETANHNFTKMTEKFEEHTKADANEFGKSEEFRKEVRDFMVELRSKMK